MKKHQRCPTITEIFKFWKPFLDNAVIEMAEENKYYNKMSKTFVCSRCKCLSSKRAKESRQLCDKCLLEIFEGRVKVEKKRQK